MLPAIIERCVHNFPPPSQTALFLAMCVDVNLTLDEFMETLHHGVGGMEGVGEFGKKGGGKVEGMRGIGEEGMRERERGGKRRKGEGRGGLLPRIYAVGSTKKCWRQR